MARIYAEVARRGNGATIGRIADQEGVPESGAQQSFRRLASTLGLVAAGGPAAFYQGQLATRIDDAARADGAWLRQADLSEMAAIVEPAERVELGDATLWLTPFPSQASITGRILDAVSAGDDPASPAFAERQHR